MSMHQRNEFLIELNIKNLSLVENRNKREKSDGEEEGKNTATPKQIEEKKKNETIWRVERVEE